MQVEKMLALAMGLAACLCAEAPGGRVTVPLDGTWSIDESIAPEDLPAAFRHKVPVPGLVHLAEPAFPDVDLFDSRELILRGRRAAPAGWTPAGSNGISRQPRNYFWYERRFTVPARREVAILKIGKAQFGTAVWLNGRKIGEHLGCFSAGYFDLTGAIRWTGENRLVIRVGAHPGVLSPSVPAGTDFEKLKWTPGIYDSVFLYLADNPVIESVQVAPRIRNSEIVIQTVVRNYSAQARTASLNEGVLTARGGRVAAEGPPRPVALGAREARTLTRTLRIPGATLWSPENPFLYVLESATGGDRINTRFGMREIRFDTPTRRCYLNGKVYFLRGSNITLHRFFEDPKCGTLPWNGPWVRRLLADIPKRMHWNSFRFCIGPVPDRWLDIADEAGLLIQNEFFIWTGRDAWHQEWTADELKRQYREWMRDNWNHPSVAIWDAANETIADVLGDDIIPSTRALDLSNRPWENGYNLPQGPDDPVEDHPYLFSSFTGKGPHFRMSELERMTGAKSTNSGHPTAHAAILNEYGWLWLNRDGTPTELTKNVYNELLGPDASAEQRFALDAYLLGGLTEFWRAHRNFAGVLHFVYLTASFPGAFTSDHFLDVERLELEPHFADYLAEAFKPLGVYINFWQPRLEAGSEHDFAVMIVNDEYRTAEGKLVLSLAAPGGSAAVERALPFSIPPLGQQTYKVRLRVPNISGEYWLKAAAWAGRTPSPTLSRRRVSIVAK